MFSFLAGGQRPQSPRGGLLGHSTVQAAWEDPMLGGAEVLVQIPTLDLEVDRLHQSLGSDQPLGSDGWMWSPPGLTVGVTPSLALSQGEQRSLPRAMETFAAELPMLIRGEVRFCESRLGIWLTAVHNSLPSADVHLLNWWMWCVDVALTFHVCFLLEYSQAASSIRDLSLIHI